MASKKTRGTAAQISANLEAARKAGTLGKLVGHGDAAKFGSGAMPTDAAGLNAAFGKSDIKVSGGSSRGKSSGGSSKSSTGYQAGWSAEQAAAETARKNAKTAAPAAGAGSGGMTALDTGAAGGLGASGGGGGGGVGAAGTSSSMAGLMNAMGDEGGSMPFAPPEALGLRAGLGQRAYPTPNLALAMLGKAY